MHRREIDHPRYIPEESRGLLDFQSGKDRGRIYRIVKDAPRTPGSTGRAWPPERAQRPEALDEIVTDLESADEWWRARSQRLLLERADRAAIPAIERIATRGTQPEARARALWTLRGLKGLSATAVNAALRDVHAGVREQGVQFAGELIAAGGAEQYVAPLVATAADSDPRVRFCAALALGGVADARVVPALAAIALRDGEDRWTRAAVLSGIAGRMDAFLAALQDGRAQNPKALAVVMEHLGRVFGAGGSPEACRAFLNQMLTGEGDVSSRLASVLGLIEGFRARGGPKAATNADPFAAILGEQNTTTTVQPFLRLAAERAIGDRAATRERVSAVSLLGYTPFEFSGATLGRLLDARQPPELQLQAVRAIERIGDPRGGALLIAKENWSRYTPQVREAVIATLTAKPPLIAVLFDAIKTGVIKAPEISSVRRTQLIKHTDATVRGTAEEIFKDLEGGDRMQVYRTFRETLAANTDVARGREAFLKTCSACHTYQGTGGKVGPDLTGIRNQPADAVLLHILVPNYEVAPNYQTLSVVTQDGRSLSGWLSAETENSLVLLTAAGAEETVLRRNITTLTASGVSLMPDGLEQTMTKEDVGNLVAFLKSER
jgi:putative heme-binding domain-containing protein